MEQVFVVRRADFFAGDWPQGFIPLRYREARNLVVSLEAGGFFAQRDRAEDNPAWKQLIPYCAITFREQVFCVERLTNQGEARLHGKLSIGIGGHVNPQDGPSKGLVARALQRELAEELALPEDPLPAPQLIGLLNDDSDPVGRVHCGLVHCLEIPRNFPNLGAQLGIRENSKMRGGFRGLAGSTSLWQDESRLESWSKQLLGVLTNQRHGRITEADPHPPMGRTQF